MSNIDEFLEIIESLEQNMVKVKKEKIIAKFGEVITKITGLTEFAVKSDGEILDIKVIPDKDLACILIENHWLEDVVKVGMKSQIYVIKKGSLNYKDFVFKPPTSKIEDPSREFGKIKIKRVTKNSVSITAVPKKPEYTPSKIIIKII